MEVQTSSTTQTRRYAHQKKDPKLEPYWKRVELARNAALDGLGVEDLEVKFNIIRRDAWSLVFGRNE